MNNEHLKQSILDKWPRGTELPGGFLQGTSRMTLNGIAIMLKMEITPDLMQAVEELLAEGQLRGDIQHFLTVKGNEVDHALHMEVLLGLKRA